MLRKHGAELLLCRRIQTARSHSATQSRDNHRTRHKNSAAPTSSPGRPQQKRAPHARPTARGNAQLPAARRRHGAQLFQLRPAGPAHGSPAPAQQISASRSPAPAACAKKCCARGPAHLDVHNIPRPAVRALHPPPPFHFFSSLDAPYRSGRQQAAAGQRFYPQVFPIQCNDRRPHIQRYLLRGQVQYAAAAIRHDHSAADDKVRQTVEILLRLGKQPFGLRRPLFLARRAGRRYPRFMPCPPLLRHPKYIAKGGPVMNKTRLGRGRLPARRLGPWRRLPGSAAGSRAVIPAGGLALPLYPAACAVSVSCSVQLADSQPARPGALVCVGSSWLGGYAVCAHNTAALRRGGRPGQRPGPAVFWSLGCCSSPGFVIGCVGGQLPWLGCHRRSAVRAAAGGQPALRRTARPLAAPRKKSNRGRCPPRCPRRSKAVFQTPFHRRPTAACTCAACVVFFRTISGVISRFLPPGPAAAAERRAGDQRRLRRSCGARRRGGAVRLLRLSEPAGLFCLCADAGHSAEMCAAAAAFCFPPYTLWAFSAPCPPLPAASAAGTAGIFQPGSARCGHEPPVARYGGDRFLLLLRRSLQNRTKKL